MKSLAVSEFKARCIAELKTLRESGDELVITLRGEPLARVLPIRDNPRQLGAQRGSMEVLGQLLSSDLDDDFTGGGSEADIAARQSMTLLLDTHVLVWTQEAPAKLGPKTQSSLLDPGNEILVSAASTFEIARLVHLGRIVLKVGLDAWLVTALNSLQARSLPIDHRTAHEAYAMPGTFHKDPADRLLVATARVVSATLVTADDLILKYRHVQTSDARK